MKTDARVVTRKTPEDFDKMAIAGACVAAIHAATREAAQPGTSLLELDAISAEILREWNCRSSFLGYHGYPATLCVSVNEEIVHGIPGPRRVGVGDMVSVDCGAILDGWHGDAAFTAIVPGGDPDPEGAELVAVTEQSLWRGIAAIAAGERLNAVGAAVEDHVGDRFGIVGGYGGHGIGTAMHQDPHVLNYRTRDRGPRMRPGLCLAVEPMLVAGDSATRVLADEWTVVARDGSRAAH